MSLPPIGASPCGSSAAPSRRSRATGPSHRSIFPDNPAAGWTWCCASPSPIAWPPWCSSPSLKRLRDRSSMPSSRARDEGIDERSRSLFKEGLEHHGGQAIGEGEAQHQVHPAAGLSGKIDRCEGPVALERLEGAADEPHGDAPIGGKLIACGELGVQRPASHPDAGDEFPLGPGLNVRARAPRQKQWIAFDVVDQREHPLRRLRDQCRAPDFPHR